jgi:hypothetical protein
LKKELNAYFLGTEAPDLGAKLAGVGDGYHDTGRFHCSLLAASVGGKSGEVAQKVARFRGGEAWEGPGWSPHTLEVTGQSEKVLPLEVGRQLQRGGWAEGALRGKRDSGL